MHKSSLPKSRIILCTLPIGCLILAGLTAMIRVPREFLQTGSWTTAQIISTSPISETVYSWFPDIAVDEFNSVHVVWCSDHLLPNSQILEQVGYTRLTSSGWSQTNDIVPPSFDIIRNAITTDLNGHLLLLYGGTTHDRTQALYFTEANVDQAGSAQAWSPYTLINRGVSYMSDIAVDSHGVIHVIYDDTIYYPGETTKVVYSDIYYRKSTDGGKTWSSPVNLSSSPETGSARAYLFIDEHDTIHVTWDEGWDRLTGVEAGSSNSVYIYSSDGGETWSNPKIIDYPGNELAQLTVGSSNKGGVILIWRSKLEQKVYFTWSNDGGKTWSGTSVIHGVFTRPWANIPYDMYDTAMDSNGNIHLILVGQPAENNPIPGVYHVVWDGKQWSKPDLIFYRDNFYPEYPKIIISNGNQIHTTWFTREGSLYTLSNREVWYSSSLANAPYVAIQPRQTSTMPLPTVTKTPRSTATPQPTISSVGIAVTSPTKEKEYLRIIAIALSPVVLLIGGVIIFQLLIRSYKRP